ncbi:hypothetical protein NL676_028633 [Syzygium grande]|nr:hypothetical protein NL676_028633 [Syzygium grande]
MSRKACSGSVGMSSYVNSLETEGIKKRQFGEGGMNKKVTEDTSPAALANGRGLGTGSTSGSRKDQLEDMRRVNFGKRSLTDTRKMLIDEAKKKILKKLHEWSSEEELADGLNSLRGKVKQKYSKEGKAPANGAKTAAVKHRKPVDGKDGVHIKKTSHAISNVESEAENSVFRQMLVADPDFHDFDNDRTEISFADNQVWATYDDDDGMPRYYALIHIVISLKPFKGDVWALYRKWSSDWNESTPNEVVHSYDMVEVIEDSNEDSGVTVAPLIKVCGFKTVFQKHPDPCKLWTIPREEMFRFSHQVPAHLLQVKKV